MHRRLPASASPRRARVNPRALTRCSGTSHRSGTSWAGTPCACSPSRRRPRSAFASRFISPPFPSSCTSDTEQDVRLCEHMRARENSAVRTYVRMHLRTSALSRSTGGRIVRGGGRQHMGRRGLAGTRCTRQSSSTVLHRSRSLEDSVRMRHTYVSQSRLK